MENIVEDAQASTPDQSEVGPKIFGRCEREFVNHSTNGVGEIILQRSSGQRIIKGIRYSVHETIFRTQAFVSKEMSHCGLLHETA
jgi:hypothetical protein